MSSKLSQRQIWTFGGGKGGVGKSIVCSNIAIELSKRGFDVLVIDCDFGGANIHTCLGSMAPNKSLSDFLISKVKHLNHTISDTSFDNLRIISGAKDNLEVANPSYLQLKNLKSAINDLEADFILIDLGAGSAIFTLDMFLLGDHEILVTVPEPTSIENTYRFMKSVFYRRLKSIIFHPGVKSWLEDLLNNRLDDPPKTPSELKSRIYQINQKAGESLERETNKFRPSLIINQVRSENEENLGDSMKEASKKYFGFDIDYLGFLEHDPVILKSMRIREPFLRLAPTSKSAKKIKSFVDRLLKIE